MQHLDASNNKIESLDGTLDVIMDLPKLSKLVLDKNSICSYPNYFPRVIEATLKHHLSSLDYRKIDDATYIAIEFAIGNLTDSAEEDLGKSASAKIEAHYKIKLDALKSAERLNGDRGSKASAHDPVVASLMAESIIDAEKKLSSLVEFVRHIEEVQTAQKADMYNTGVIESASYPDSIQLNNGGSAESNADIAGLTSLQQNEEAERNEKAADLVLPPEEDSLPLERSEDLRHTTLAVSDYSTQDDSNCT